MIFLVNQLREIYKILTLNIMGLDEVKNWVKFKPLEKTVIDAKKRYLGYQNEINDFLNKENLEVNVLVKIFNDFYNKNSLAGSDEDKQIKMLISGTNKSIKQLMKIKCEDKAINKLISDVIEDMAFYMRAWHDFL